MIVLDTNTIIYLSKELISIEKIFIANEEYAVSVITYIEVLGYDFESDKEEDFIKKLFKTLKIIYIDYTIAQNVIILRKKYKIKLPDAVICATSLVNNASLITNDLRLKKINELKLNLIGISDVL